MKQLFITEIRKLSGFLASQSPRRQELLSQLGIKFGICDSDVNEDIPLMYRYMN